MAARRPSPHTYLLFVLWTVLPTLNAFPAVELANALDLRSRLRLDTHAAARSLLAPHRAELDPLSLGRVLSALKKKRSSDAAVATIAFALESCPLVLNTQHWTVALKACRRASQWRASQELIETMQATGHAPDLECYSVAALTCANCGLPVAVAEWPQPAVQASVQMLRDALEGGMLPEASTCAPVIAALGAAGRGEEAVAFFGELSAAGVAHDSTTYNAVVVSAQGSSLPEQTLSAFEAMRVEGFEPDQAAYRAALEAAESMDQKVLTEQLLNEGMVLWHWAPRVSPPCMRST